MKNLPRLLQFLAQYITLGLAAAFVITVLAPQWTRGVRELAVPAVPTPPAAAPNANTADAIPVERSGREGPYSYADAVRRAAPAVVSIYANKHTITAQNALLVRDPSSSQIIGAIPVGPRFEQPQQSAGSGVIFNMQGYVLTNNHVIDGAEDIQAQLSDGRAVAATVVGADPETDLAVLKLDQGVLPVIPIAAHAPEPGDVVLAIGSPFRLSNTVTMGIVSAIGRQLTASSYQDFIQTDASINQGNSGGALVNASGELVGINSDIYTPKGGNIGIGFAIPVNTAKSVLDQIIAHGKVVRGWMGIDYEDPAPQLTAGDLFGAVHGAIVRSVVAGTPAAAAGVQAGDRLVQFNGFSIVSQADLHARESELAPGTKVRLGALRNGRAIEFNLTVLERPRPGSTVQIKQ
jgi:serine protease DegQ